MIAQTIIPLAASKLDRTQKKKQNGAVDWIRDRYVRLLKWNMRHRWQAQTQL